MKILTIILILFAVAMIGFNVTMLDFDSPFQGDSLIAVIGIIASLCAILLLSIFYQSKKIQDKLKEQEK
ncbi:MULTISPECIES: hypothetical protein [Galbibacter]|uniref:Uncharacterized protein n=1 Tax=Galbibacter pacificus TaxID=2996052 RepID=A0ABT6FTV9_9FLAO|nr:hypothetical protein [Galbibacter pacificus]MDG3583222.1 hypothetical protein [Galbibacter pacificus]MDG3586703.1 hypothetical protein [Galbibacter pacificus]